MSDIEQKPKRVMTEEQKAKMKAGREAAKLKKEEAKANGGAGAEPEPAPKSDSDASSGSKRKGKPLTDEQKAKMKAGRDAAKVKREADKAAGIETPKKEKKEPKVPAAPKKAEKPKVADFTTTTAIRVNFMMRNEEWKKGDDDQDEWHERIYYFATNDAIRRFITREFHDHDSQMFQEIIEDLDMAEIPHATFINKVADAPIYQNNSFGLNLSVIKSTVELFA
jgi:hypothetical protein